MTNKSRKWLFGVAALALVFCAAWGWYLFDVPAKVQVAEKLPDLPSSNPYAHPKTLAVAERRGRCRSLDYHLARLAQATDAKQAENELKAMALLTGEMMNGYPIETTDKASSRALPAIYTPEGRLDLQQTRNKLLDTLRAMRGQSPKEAASQVTEACMACHSHFMRETDMPSLGSAR